MPDIRGLVTDPQFKALSPERKRALLERTGADPNFVNELLGSPQPETGVPSAKEMIGGALTGFAGRMGDVATKDIPTLAKTGYEFWKSSPRWAGGGADEIIPRSQVQFAGRMLEGEGSRIAERAKAALASEPFSREQVENTAGAIPIAGETASEVVGGTLSGDPKRIGRAMAELALLGIQVKGMRTMPEWGGASRVAKMREARLKNLTQATGAGPTSVPFFKKNLEEIQLPVGGMRKLEDVTTKQRQVAGQAVADAESGLLGSNAAVLSEDLQRAIPTGTRPREYFNPKTGEVTTVEVTGDPAMAKALRSRSDAIKAQYRDEPVGMYEVVQRKKEVQAAANRAKLYDQTPGGPAVTPEAAALGEEGNVLKSAIENAAERGDKAARAYVDATKKDSLAIGVNEPVAARQNARMAAKTGGSHPIELIGRSATPMGVSGASAARALAGLGVVKIWNSVPWNTLAAATRWQLLRVLETEGFDAFRNNFSRAVVTEHKRRQAAEKILNDQGKGVVGP